jgi:hypothetical protein
MLNGTTVGDDYAAPCPSCRRTMNVGKITKAGLLTPGHVDMCDRCGEFFEVEKIVLIPVVYYRKKEYKE